MPPVRTTECGVNCLPDAIEQGKLRWIVDQIGPPPADADRIDCPSCGAHIPPYANICIDHAKFRPYCPACGTALMESQPYDDLARRAIYG